MGVTTGTGTSVVTATTGGVTIMAGTVTVTGDRHTRGQNRWGDGDISPGDGRCRDTHSGDQDRRGGALTATAGTPAPARVVPAPASHASTSVTQIVTDNAVAPTRARPLPAATLLTCVVVTSVHVLAVAVTVARVFPTYVPAGFSQSNPICTFGLVVYTHADMVYAADACAVHQTVPSAAPG